MRLKLIACKALFRELSFIASRAPHAIDITWIRQGYHKRPEQLNKWLQEEIDLFESGNDPHTLEYDEAQPFDAVLLGYGLCSNAVTGLRAKAHKLVIPRAHDCITLFLGSKERYARLFAEHPGCFWYTASWIENAGMPCEALYSRSKRNYLDMGYDEETADYLLDELGGLKNYRSAAYISMPFIDNPPYARFTREAAEFFSWEYLEFEGRLDLLERFLNGEWNNEDSLVLEPGETAVMSGDGMIIKRA